jgi:DNA-binding XRE family transcriptional regulator
LAYLPIAKLFLSLLHNIKSGDNTINAVQNDMKKGYKEFFASEKEFLAFEFKSKARIIDDKMVEVVAPDGEVFSVLAQIGIYTSEETRHYQLHLVEYVFDKNFSADKEIMTENIWRDLFLNGVTFMGMSPGDKQGERSRIGEKIRQIREEKGIEAKDLARLAKIDAANLSRIEKGKYSVGLDILSKLASALGYHIDIVPNQM